VIPPFSLEAAPGAAWRLGVSVLVLMAACVVTAWLASGGDVAPWLTAAAFMATLPAVGLLRRPAGDLRWDGTRFRRDGAEGTLDLCLDLGPWMLLRWRPAATTWPWVAQWRAVSARGIGPGDWHALRCALHARPAGTDG
jgi:hypothetical protein